MYLRILNEANEYMSLLDYSPPRGAKFNNYLINNNPITFTKREYILEVEELPYSYDKRHPKHKQWQQFLEDNPHVISNFDTRNYGALEYLFERWQLMHNNG